MSKSILGVLAFIFASSFFALAVMGSAPDTPPRVMDVGEYRLVGFGCGPEGRTMLSRDESDFGMDCKEIRRLDQG